MTSHVIFHELSQLGIGQYIEIDYMPEFRNPHALDEFYFPRDLFILLSSDTIYIPSPLTDKKDELNAYIQKNQREMNGLVYGKALNPKVQEWVHEFFSKVDDNIIKGKTCIEGGNIQFACTQSGVSKVVIGLTSLLISCHRLFSKLPSHERMKEENIDKTKQIISDELGIDLGDLVVLPHREYHLDLEMVVADGVAYYHDDQLALELLESIESRFGANKEFQEIKASAEKRAKKQGPVISYCREVLTSAGFAFKEVPGHYTFSAEQQLPEIYINFMNGIFFGEGRDQFFLTNGCQSTCSLQETSLVRELQRAFEKSFEQDVRHLTWDSTRWLHSKRSGIRCATNFLPLKNFNFSA